MQKELIEDTLDLELILPDLFSVESDYWLTTHRELHTSKRIRLVYEMLAQETLKLLR